MIASAPPSARTFAVSIVARSMVTEPTLRVSRARSPLAVMSICSPALAALNSSVSVPPSPSTVSLASPGSHWKRSFPLPSLAVSAPRLPSATSSPEPPISVSPNAPPRRLSLPAPPSSVIGVEGAPPAWKTMSSSSPPPPLTSTALNAARSIVYSMLPSAPTSSATLAAWLKRRSLLPAASPVICRVPSSICRLVAAPAGAASARVAVPARTAVSVGRILMRRRYGERGATEITETLTLSLRPAGRRAACASGCPASRRCATGAPRPCAR